MSESLPVPEDAQILHCLVCGAQVGTNDTDADLIHHLDGSHEWVQTLCGVAPDVLRYLDARVPDGRAYRT